MKCYKLTDQDMRTWNGFQWVLGIERKAKGKGKELCSNGYLHCYASPDLAALLNPIHADYKNPRLFEAEGSGDYLDDRGLKGGYKRMTLVRELALPVFTTAQRVAFGVYCAAEVYDDREWVKWANAWLTGVDRSNDSARMAAAAATAAAYSAANANAYAAANAAAATAVNAANAAARAAAAAAAADDDDYDSAFAVAAAVRVAAAAVRAAAAARDRGGSHAEARAAAYAARVDAITHS